MFGKCKVCEEKDKRIEDLKAEIAHFRTIQNPPPRQAVLRYEMEADNLLTGGNSETLKSPIDLEAEAKELARLQAEQDRILTGNY